MNLLPTAIQEYLPQILSAMGGIVVTWMTQRILKKRGTFSYFVTHNKIGQSADDPVHGQVRVTWNNEPIPNLYLSTVELVNESMNDYENVIVRAYSADTNLLSEQTQIKNTSRILEWSDRYKAQMQVNAGDSFSDSQKQIFFGQREYVIPAMNRGQVVKFDYLNSAKGVGQPSIWLDVVHKGVKLKFRPPQNQLFGVPRNQAAWIGVLLGIVFVLILISTTNQPWLTTIVAFVYGVLIVIPGAYAIKMWRKIREIIGD